MKLAAACRKVSCHATVAWRKRNIFRKSMTQENWGSHNELATDRNMTSREGVTRCKVDFVKNYSTRVNADQETWKGRIKNVGGRRPLCQKKKVTTENAIRGCRSKQQSHLGRRGTRKMIFRQEDALLRDTGMIHERHLQAEHDPPCKSGTAKRNRWKERTGSWTAY
jgi:hypothetical protein